MGSPVYVAAIRTLQVDSPSFLDHLMLRKFFGGDSSAELILLIRPNPRKKWNSKKKIENVARGNSRSPRITFLGNPNPLILHPVFILTY